MVKYSEDYLKTFGGQEGCEWLDLHYEVMYAKYIYYVGVRLGFDPMSDDKYDKIESNYKELSTKLNKEPSASDMIGWETNAMMEALAMRQYDKKLYDKIKHIMFKFRD